MMDILSVIVFSAFCIVYYRWGEKRIVQSIEFVKKEFSTLEAKYNLSGYKCYTYNHPEVWGEVDYDEYRNEIINSARWSYSSSGGGWPQKAMEYCLTVDANRKRIYLILG
jgi:hypothetical protein